MDNHYTWVLEAKAPNKGIITGRNVEQVYSYAIHFHIRVKFYALCNGREFSLFHVDQLEPVLCFQLSELKKHWQLLIDLLSPLAFAGGFNSLAISHKLALPQVVRLV